MNRRAQETKYMKRNEYIVLTYIDAAWIMVELRVVKKTLMLKPAIKRVCLCVCVCVSEC